MASLIASPVRMAATTFVAMYGVDGVVRALNRLAEEDDGWDWRYALLAMSAVVVMSGEQQREAYNLGATTLLFRCMPELVDKPPSVRAALLSALFHLHGQFEAPAQSAHLSDNDLMPSVIIFAQTSTLSLDLSVLGQGLRLMSVRAQGIARATCAPRVV